MDEISYMGNSLKVAVTGAAGFIGSHLMTTLRSRGHEISWAIDSFKPAYGGNLCELRSEILNPNISIERYDLANLEPDEIADRLDKVDAVLHLAAFPGVRQGEIYPHKYVHNNVVSTSALLAGCEIVRPKLVVVASSSSVYGDRGAEGACIEDQADGTGIKSLYACTKWINELQLRDFTRRTGISTKALRFFTVYGEYGRPDMAYSTFTKAIKNQETVSIYGKDGGLRNMTYVKDATEMVCRLVEKTFEKPSNIDKSFEAYNIASGTPLTAMEMLRSLEIGLNRKATVIHSERPSVDSIATHADTTKLKSIIGELPVSNIQLKLREYASWYANLLLEQGK